MTILELIFTKDGPMFPGETVREIIAKLQNYKLNGVPETERTAYREAAHRCSVNDRAWFIQHRGTYRDLEERLLRTDRRLYCIGAKP